MRRFRRRFKAERGASNIEYATLLSLIAFCLIGGVSNLQTGIASKFTALTPTFTNPTVYYHPPRNEAGYSGDNPGALAPEGGGTTIMGPGPGGTMDQNPPPEQPNAWPR